MKKMSVAAALTVALVLPTVAVASPAQAAPNKKTCASAAEYRRIAAAQTMASVKRIVGNNGSTRFRAEEQIEVLFEGDGNGDYVHDSEAGVYEYVGDHNGDYVQVGTDTDGDDVPDEFTYELVGGDYQPVTLRDQVRRYASCARFNGKRPVFVWFDNYSNGPLGGGLTVYGKKTSDPLRGSGQRRAGTSTPDEGTLGGRRFHVSDRAPAA